ncbi:MAG TPA: hypothetical protein VF174_15895 [Micromonosporaceae bacterium]
MGFVLQEETYKLVFDGSLEGLEVTTRSASTEDWLRISEMAGVLRDFPPAPEDVAKLRQLFETFADALVGWNLERSPGKKVPATVKGVLSLDPKFVARVILAWMDAVAGTTSAEDIEATLPVELD